MRIERGERPVVHTANGSVRARFVIVACNAYIGDLDAQKGAMAVGSEESKEMTKRIGLVDNMLVGRANIIHEREEHAS